MLTILNPGSGVNILGLPETTGTEGSVDFVIIYDDSATANRKVKLSNLLPDGVLSADAAGRAKMADGFINLSKIGTGIFTADSAGRLKFAPGFVDPTLCATDLFINIAPVGAVLQTEYVEVRTRIPIDADVSAGKRIPYDNSAPLIGEGQQILAKSITPKLNTSKVRVQVDVPFECSATDANVTIAVFRGTSLVSARGFNVPNNDSPTFLSLTFLDSPASTSSQAYTVRMGPDGANVIAVCGRRAAETGIYADNSAASLTLQEIKA